VAPDLGTGVDDRRLAGLERIGPRTRVIIPANVVSERASWTRVMK
jgi:hypothetical protein